MRNKKAQITMPSCEKCWKEAEGNIELYYKLLGTNKCTLEEQAGEDAVLCRWCNRKTIHQSAHRCMNPGCKSNAEGH